MTIEKFVKEELNPEIEVTNLGYIPNKRLAKVFKRYNDISVEIYWYDDEDNPDYLTWIDVEGIGYGWMWLGYKNNKKKLFKELYKFGLGMHTNEEIYTFESLESKETVYYLFELRDSVVVIGLSKGELENY